MLESVDGGVDVGDALALLQTVLEYAGTVAFGISGALVAGRRRLDLVGVMVLGSIVAVGGGTLRDLVIGDLPVFWVENPVFVVVGAAAALATIPVARAGVLSRPQYWRIVDVTDAAGMALFAVSGTNAALAVGANPIAAALVGVIAGVGGGLVRDVLANEIPQVLVNGQLYATAALAGTLLHVGLLDLGLDAAVSVWVTVAVIFLLRVTALLRGWGVPRVELPGPDGGTG